MRMSVATVPTLPRASRTIGAILMDAGLLSAEDAEQILRLQRQNNLRFGEAAIRLGLLTEADIPWMRMNSLDQLIDDPHLAATGFFHACDHPSEGAITTMAVPARFSQSSPELRRHAPRFGEHSAELLREAGYSQGEIAQMIADGVTVAEPDATAAGRQP